MKNQQSAAPLPRKVIVTERALLQRINRSLAKQAQSLKKSRPGTHMAAEYGTYYSVDLRTNNIVGTWKDAQALVREFDVLRPYEALSA
jgi:hypothetical protein